MSMIANDLREIAELYRDNLGLFAFRFLTARSPGREILWNYHHDVLCDRLMRLEAGEYLTLIVNMPPRTLKSEICSIAYPAWLMLRNPDVQILSMSYEESLAEALSRGSRDIMRTEAYKAIGSTRLSPVQTAANEYETTAGGKRVARSIGGAVTGRGGDYLILDDLAPAEHAVSESGRKRLNERISNTLISRSNTLSTGRTLVVAQRLHQDDATAIFLAMGECEHLVIPAIAAEPERFEYRNALGAQVHVRAVGEAIHPERDPVSAYRKLERGMSPVDFAAQYQQNPIPAEGNIVKLDWFPTYLKRPDKFEQVIISWDTATKVEEVHDFSAMVAFGRIGMKAWVLNVFQGRLDYTDLKLIIRERAQQFGATVVLIEDAGSGQILVPDLKREGFHAATPVKAMMHKELRLRAATSMMRDGNILLPVAEMWLEPFTHQLGAFPAAKHDDMVDAFVHGILWMKENPPVPHIRRFYEEEALRGRGGREEPTIRVQSPMRTFGRIVLINGHELNTDADGSITLAESDALPLLRAGWLRAD